jgi:cation transport regulator ChaB
MHRTREEGEHVGGTRFREVATMPRDRRGEDVPSTLERSPKKARETWKKAHDSAVETYGEGERAHRTAFSALKHSFEKVGDHWEPKDRKGPSDPRAERRGARARRGEGESFGGVDVEGHSKRELLEMARKAGVQDRSKMTKEELARALARANQRATARARERKSA